jgi:hypothetical protein
MVHPYREAVVPLRSWMLGDHIFRELIEYSPLWNTDYPVPIQSGCAIDGEIGLGDPIDLFLGDDGITELRSSFLYG